MTCALYKINCNDIMCIQSINAANKQMNFISNLIYTIQIQLTFAHAIKLAASIPVGLMTYNFTSAAITLLTII